MYLFLVELTGAISDFMYSYLLIILLLAVGVYFTFRTGLVQIRMLKEAEKTATNTGWIKHSRFLHLKH